MFFSSLICPQSEKHQGQTWCLWVALSRDCATFNQPPVRKMEQD